MFLDGVSGGGSIGVSDISLFWLLANNSTQASCNGTSTLSMVSTTFRSDLIFSRVS